MSSYTCEDIEFVEVPTLFGFDRLPDVYLSGGIYFTSILLYLSIKFFEDSEMESKSVEKVLSRFAFVYDAEWNSKDPFQLIPRGKIILCRELEHDEMKNVKLYRIV